MRRRKLAVAVAAGIAGALAAAAPANATVTCDFNAGAETLTISMSADNDQATVRVVAGTIEVIGIPTCTNGNATTTTIDDINVVDNSAAGDTRVAIRDPLAFAPGSEIEEGSAARSEIEFNVVPGGGTSDRIEIQGTVANDIWRFGNGGLNVNVGAGIDDVEVVAVGQPDFWTFSGDDQVDNFSAQGGNGSGAAYTGTARLRMIGGEGDDVLRGGDSTAGDDLEGLQGSDTVLGFAGDDSVGGGPGGTNSLDGGTGVDDGSFRNADSVTVDLGISGPQDTGGALDTLTSIEGLVGSDSRDTLIGDGGPNRLDGRDGDDFLDGSGGNDTLADTADGATAVYAQSPGGVNADLTAGTATGGAGVDTLSGITDLTGSPFADTLTGSALANRITGLGGADTISALAGPDTVDVRDGEADTASCGTEIDTATADRASLDVIDPDCETTSFLPEPDPGDGGGGGGGGGDGTPAQDTSIEFTLSGKAKQRVLRRKRVVATASCPLEACTVTAGGPVKPLTAELEAAVPERLALELRRKPLRKVAKALERGKKPKLKVRAEVTDAAGNAAADTLRVKAKR